VLPGVYCGLASFHCVVVLRRQQAIRLFSSWSRPLVIFILLNRICAGSILPSRGRPHECYLSRSEMGQYYMHSCLTSWQIMLHWSEASAVDIRTSVAIILVNRELCRYIPTNHSCALNGQHGPWSCSVSRPRFRKDLSNIFWCVQFLCIWTCVSDGSLLMISLAKYVVFATSYWPR
jgi:hypothetical protein